MILLYAQAMHLQCMLMIEHVTCKNYKIHMPILNKRERET